MLHPVGPHVGQRLLRIGRGRVPRRLDRLAYDVQGALVGRGDRLLGHAQLGQPSPRDVQRVVLEPAFDLLGRTVGRRVGTAVAEVPVGRGLQQGGPVSCPGPPRQGGDGVPDRDDVVAVDRLARDAVGGRPVGGGPGDRGDVGDRRVLHVQVVLADEEHRQLPYGGQVERLVEGSDVGRAVAEEGHRDLAGAAQPRRPGRAGRHREMGADDGVGAEHVRGRLGQVHGAALASAQPRGPAHEFGEALLGVAPRAMA